MFKFLGFAFFVMMFVIGFWGIIFFTNIALVWVAIGPAELYGPLNKDSDPEEVRRKKLNEQADVEVLFSKA